MSRSTEDLKVYTHIGLGVSLIEKSNIQNVYIQV